MDNKFYDVVLAGNDDYAPYIATTLKSLFFSNCVEFNVWLLSYHFSSNNYIKIESVCNVVFS